RLFFFFFQAEDGIRDFHVTGVQTCALPICSRASVFHATAPRPCGLLRPLLGDAREQRADLGLPVAAVPPEGADRRQLAGLGPPRSEERRVGKEWRSRWSRDH